MPLLCCLSVVLLAWAPAEEAGDAFTIAVIPDTQNYVDYQQQKAAGFPIDSRELFFEQMRYVAAHAQSQGGDIVFSTSVGDMWQHFSLDIDPAHASRGFKHVSNPAFGYYEGGRPETRAIEIPTVAKGYELIAGKLPFSVVPGNHDYDAMWTDARYPPVPSGKGSLRDGLVNFTGLSNFQSVFSDQGRFFKGRDWYVGAHDGGADSAQAFSAGGYRFLHVGLQYNPPDEALVWAQSMIDRHRGVPTIVSTHHYLAPNGERGAQALADPERNQPEAVWDKLIRRNDEIFMVLSGHRCSQGFRVEDNAARHRVYQILADYQCRWQVAKNAGRKEPGAGLGDGWLRLMRFDMSGTVPKVHVRTYSPHYKQFSSDLPEYAEWYLPVERPGYLAEEFLAADDFAFELTDFRARFPKAAEGSPRPPF